MDIDSIKKVINYEKSIFNCYLIDAFIYNDRM